MSLKNNVKFKNQNSKLWNRSAISFYIFTLSFCILIFTIFITKNTALSPSSSLLQREGGGEFSPPITTLLAVGDIMLSRNVAAEIEKSGNPNLSFEKLQNELSGADITFGNLECPLDPGGKPGGQGLVFRCPAKYVSGLVNSGFDVLSTANNHAFDQGADNIDFTIDYLKSQNIRPIGTFPSSNESPSFTKEGLGEFGEVIVRNGIRFGFLAYSYTAFNDGGKSVHPQIATMDVEKMKNEVRSLKGHNADVVIVSMHAGTEYTRQPNQMQIDFAHAAINAGANIVIGHHPHWIQTIETYTPSFTKEGDGGSSSHKGLIFYSLGNFIFDQMFSPETRQGLMVKFEFSGQELKSYELLPIIIDNYCCPRLATDGEKQKILEKVKI